MDNLFDEKNKKIKMNVRNIYQHNIFMREMSFPESHTTYCGHHHFYDHVTMVASGKVRVKFNAVPEANIPEEIKEYSAVDMFVTRSFRTHEITSLEPNTTVCCIHAIREKNGEIVEPQLPDNLKHDTNFKFKDVYEIEAITDKKLKRVMFDAYPADLKKLLDRGNVEGTVVPGSQDKFHN
jgi:hypothetical protein